MDIIPPPPHPPPPPPKKPALIKNDADENTCMKFILKNLKINKVNKKPQIITEKFSGNSL